MHPFPRIVLATLVGVAMVLTPSAANAAEPWNPGVVHTLPDPSFDLTWQPTDPAALQEIDDLVAEGTHGITDVTMSSVMGDRNRALPYKTDARCSGPNSAISGLDATKSVAAWCFQGNGEDDQRNTWYPQGIAYGADDAGTPSFAVSWYQDIVDAPNRARVSLTTKPATNAASAYRHALLVVPSVSATGQLTIRDANINDVTKLPRDADDLNLHAGGIGWVGDHLFVADTTGGMRVFDTVPYQVAIGSGLGLNPEGQFTAHTYKYVLFEIGRYNYNPTDGDRCQGNFAPPRSETTDLCFSTLSVDQTFSTPNIVTTEYRTSASVTESAKVRIVRWPLGSGGMLAHDANGVVRSAKVYGTVTPRVQGVAMYSTTQPDGQSWSTAYLSASYSSGGVPQRGDIYSDRGGRNVWHVDGVVGAESFAYDAAKDWIWGVTEHPDQRVLYAVQRTEMQPSADNLVAR